MTRKENHLAAMLQRTPIFHDLAAPQLAQLLATTREQRYARGTMILQKGDRPSSLLVVVAGKIKEACQSPEGDERIIEILGPHQTCGEAALFLDCPLPFSVTALTNALLLHVEKATVLTLAENQPAFSKYLLSALSQRLMVLVRDIEALAEHSPMQRLAGYLIEHCRDCTETVPIIALPTAKQVIASRLGMTPESLSRAFRDLTDADMIEVQGSQVVVLDLPRLRAFSQ